MSRFVHKQQQRKAKRCSTPNANFAAKVQTQSRPDAVLNAERRALAGTHRTIANTEQQGTPRAFIDPISLELMTDPVITSDGVTYDRSTISRWLLSKTTSPLTGLQLESTNLIPNTALRHAIEEDDKHERAAVAATVAECDRAHASLTKAERMKLSVHSCEQPQGRVALRRKEKPHEKAEEAEDEDEASSPRQLRGKFRGW